MVGDEKRDRLKKFFRKDLTTMRECVLMANVLANDSLTGYNDNGPLACAFQCSPEQRGLTGLVL
jgi:hypothetical protein